MGLGPQAGGEVAPRAGALRRAGCPIRLLPGASARGVAAIAAFVDAVAQSTLPAARAFEGASFESWPAAVRAAAQGIDPARPAILVIDELPYLTEADRGFPADLQQAWDRVLESAPLLLVCIGSDARMMENLVGARSPLHGRPTLELRVSPLNPAEVAGAHLRVRCGSGVRSIPDRGWFPAAGGLMAEGGGMRAFLRKSLAARPNAVRRDRPADHGLGVPAGDSSKRRDRGNRARRGLLRPDPATQRGQGQHTQRRAGSSGRAEGTGCERAPLLRSPR